MKRLTTRGFAPATALKFGCIIALGTSLAVSCSKSGDSSDDAAGGGGGKASGGEAGGGSKSGGSGGSSKSGGSGGTGGTGGTALEAVKVDDYPAKLAAAQCGPIWECCADHTAASPTVGGAKEATCPTLKAAGPRQGLTDLKASIEAGRVAYDGVKMAECIARLDALACTDTKETVAEAYGPCLFLTPKVAVDGVCVINADCIESFCDSVTKKCTTHRELGESCTTAGDCVTRKCVSVAGVKKCAEPEPDEVTIVEGFCGALFLK